jgi:hypothetical protein
MKHCSTHSWNRQSFFSTLASLQYVSISLRSLQRFKYVELVLQYRGVQCLAMLSVLVADCPRIQISANRLLRAVPFVGEAFGPKKLCVRLYGYFNPRNSCCNSVLMDSIVLSSSG